MPFVKLDCGILNSTLWFEREAREVFLTALLMAEPFELTEPTDQIEVDSLQSTGWSVPAGWYGFVQAAGVGIIHRAKVDEKPGIVALKQLGSPEESSRSREYDGRRLVRVNGGYIVLNYFKYRDRDYTAAERMRRLRARKKDKTVTRNDDTLPRNVTQADSREQSSENIQEQDQDRAYGADEPTADDERPKPKVNILTALARSFLKTADLSLPDSELSAQLKDMAAKMKLDYDGRSIQKAIDSARARDGRERV